MPKKILPTLITLALIFGSISLTLFFINKQKHSQTIKKNNFKFDTSSSVDQLSITEKNPSSYSYKNENINYSAYFPSNFLDMESNVRFQLKDSYIQFLPLKSANNNVSAQAKDNQIFYPKIFQNGTSYIDLQYTLEANQLKEEYILNEKQTVPLLEQEVSLFNAYPIIENNQINFLHPSTDQYLFKIPIPYMYEINNPDVKHNGIIIDLQCQDPQTPLKDCRSFIFTKKITPEGQQWLNNPLRNYPVVIDPFVDGNPCWGTAGYCDSGCTHNNTSAVSVYTTCTQGSLCSGTNCWYTTAGTCNSGCIYNTSTSATVYTTCANSSTPCSGNCWGISGSCDASCSYANLNSTSHYTGCTQGATCGAPPLATYTRSTLEYKYCPSGSCNSSGTGSCYKVPQRWSYNNYGSVGCANYCTNTLITGCIPQNTSYYSTCSWIPPKYTPTVSGAITRYTLSGSCSSVGLGNCYSYRTDGTDTSYTGNGACGASTCAGSAIRNLTLSCTWAAAKYPWNATGSTTKYVSAGTPCDEVNGTGSCYKLTDGAISWTGSGAGCPGGSTTCVGGSTRYNRTQCTWYKGTGGNDIKIDGLMIEGIKIN